MKRNRMFLVVLSLVFLLASCGISVPFMWTSEKVEVSGYGKEHQIRIKDPEYTKANGYDISIMYVYTLQNKGEGSSSSYFYDFQKNSQYDTHNSKIYNFKAENINPAKEKDEKEYPVFMLKSLEPGVDNTSPSYIFNSTNINLTPNANYRMSYALDEEGFLDITVKENGKTLRSFKMARSNGKSFTDFSSSDEEFKSEKDKTEYDESGRYTITLMPVVYARSSNHPNQKFYMNTNAGIEIPEYRAETEH